MTRACSHVSDPTPKATQKLTLGGSLGLHLAGLLGHLAVGIGSGGGGSEMIVLLLDALPLCLGLAFVAHGSRRRFVRAVSLCRDAASGGFCFVEIRQARGALMGIALGAGSAGVAYRVLRHEFGKLGNGHI